MFTEEDYYKNPNICKYCKKPIHIPYWTETALMGEVNGKNNLLYLCRNHHWELDNDYLDLNMIP